MAGTEDLTQNQLFQGIAHEKIEKIMLYTTEVSYPVKARVFSEEDAAYLLYIILDGVLDLTFRFRIGNVESEIAIDTKGKGDSVGWSALVPPHIYTLSGVCRKPLRMLSIEGPSLLHLCEEDTEFGFLLMQNVAEIIGTRMKRFESMFTREVQRGISML